MAKQIFCVLYRESENGVYMKHKELFVGKDKEFKTINSAVESFSDGYKYRIYLDNGVYKEKVIITKPGLSIIGKDVNKCRIIWDDNALKLFPDGRKMGTFNSFTMYIGAPDFYMENISVENSSGSGNIVGQAVALYADSDKIFIKNCRLLGNQDTLCTGPLPIDPVPKGINPVYEYCFVDNENYKPFRQYYKDCYIEGDIDFIFGSARAVFENCEIYSIGDNIKTYGYITAGSHPAIEEFGYIFKSCKITGNGKKESVYLGRPWRPYSRTTFVDTVLSPIIHKAGWCEWNGNEVNSSYMEVSSSGPGAADSDRVKWASVSNSDKDYSLERIFTSYDKWIP